MGPFLIFTTNCVVQVEQSARCVCVCGPIFILSDLWPRFSSHSYVHCLTGQ